MRRIIVFGIICFIVSVIVSFTFSVSKSIAGAWGNVEGFTTYQASLVLFVVLMSFVNALCASIVRLEFPRVSLTDCLAGTGTMHVLGRQFVAVFLLLIGAKMALDLFGGILDADVGSTPEFLTTLMGVGFLLDSVIKRALMAADAEKDLESQDMA